MEKLRRVPKPKPGGLTPPKTLVEIKHVVTSTGKVMQEFLPRKKKGGRRGGNR